MTILTEKRFAKCNFHGFGVPRDAETGGIADAGFNVVILGMNHQDDDKNGITRADLDDKFLLIGGKKSIPRWQRAFDEFHARGVEVWLMPWARTTLAYNVTARAVLEPMTDHPAVTAIVHDTEVYWHKLLPDGMNHAQAVEQNWVPIWSELGVDQLVTDYAYAPKSIRPLLPHLTGAIPQAYSRASWTRKEGGAVYRAGRTQRVALHSWSPLLGENQALIMGLAAFDQSGHPGGVRGGMNAQAREARGAEGYAWWSWRSAGGAARRIMRTINEEWENGQTDV
jgi:hypothetical protein